VTGPCPNAAAHQWHPSSYVAHSWWADCALLIATQEKCPGCGGWEIWVPRRADLRIAVNWPPPDCDWGGCDEEGVAERLWEGRWLPVCVLHIDLEPDELSPLSDMLRAIQEKVAARAAAEKDRKCC